MSVVNVLLVFLCVIFRAFGDIPFFLTNRYQSIYINQFMNSSSTTPCSNFYEYACLQWKTDTIKPDFELSWNHFTAASYQIKKKIQHILESPVEDKYRLLYNAQTFYNACIHFEERKNQYLTDLKTLISYFGGWPILDENWNAREYNWLEEIASITRKLGFHPIIKFHVGIDYKNTEKYVFYIEPGSLIFPSNILLNPLKFRQELTAYEDWILQSIQYVFPRETAERNISEEVRKIIDFEMKLAKLMAVKPRTERNTLEHFSKRFNMHLTQIFEILFSKLDRKTELSDTIVVKNYGYFRNLLMFMRRNCCRNIANYLIWTIVKEFSRDTNIHLKNLNFSIDKKVLGIARDISRETECSNKATDYFSFAILPKYLDLFVKTDVITPIQEIAENIKAEYVDLLMHNIWLTNSTKVLAIEKARNIKCIVGYSEWMTNRTILKQYYSKLNMTDDHFKNLVLVKQFKIKRNFLLQGTTVESPQCPSNIFDVNAYYSILQNLIFVPLGIIQEPFYHEHGPRIFNYGALGSLIGHEFSHSLDTTGRQANSNGKIEKWWPNEDISGYQLRSKCFEMNKSQPHNILLIGENIADNVGLDISYRAYKKQDNAELQDIFWDVQKEKIFFLSYAQMWCEISEPLDLFSDEHTSADVRVNQAVSNNRHFNEIFDCNEKQLKDSVCKLW